MRHVWFKRLLSSTLSLSILQGTSLAALSALPTSGGQLTSNAVLGTISLPKTQTSLNFQDADVRDVLRLLAAKSNLNIIYGPDVTGPVTIHLDEVPFDQAFQTVLSLKGLVALHAGSNIVRIVTSSALSTEQSQAATFTQVFRLNYANANDVKTPIDAIRGAAGRKGVTSVDLKSNSLVITDTREGLQQVETLLPVLDRKPQQVDIEAKIVEVTLDNETDMGVSWAFARTATGGNTYGGTNKGTDNSVVAAGTGFRDDPTNTSGYHVAGPGVGTVAGTGLASQLGTFTQSAFSFIHDENAYILSAQISALMTKNKVKVLSTPHVVTLNNEPASINVVDQIPYQVSSVSQGTVSNSIQFVSPGVKLTVKPTVNADRRITLKVTPEVSNAGAAPFFGAPPTIQTRSADTTVLLKDGETIAIGGLIKEQTQKVITGIPLLMSIPILGFLFRTTTDRKVRTELIVFLTPRIAAE